MNLQQLGLEAGQRTQVDPTNDKMGKEQFLELLVAQISHQDPMSPLDDKALISQLAQFTAVEQAVETNHRLEDLVAMGGAQERTAMAGLIGKQVRLRTDALHWEPGNPAPAVTFSLPQPADQVRAVIRNAAGETVRTLEAGTTAAGDVSLPWDGRDGRGGLVAGGDYRVEVQATAAGGRPLQADQTVGRTVTGVAFVNGRAQVMVGAEQVPAPDILRIEGPSPTL